MTDCFADLLEGMITRFLYSNRETRWLWSNRATPSASRVKSLLGLEICTPSTCVVFAIACYIDRWFERRPWSGVGRSLWCWTLQNTIASFRKRKFVLQALVLCPPVCADVDLANDGDILRQLEVQHLSNILQMYKQCTLLSGENWSVALVLRFGEKTEVGLKPDASPYFCFGLSSWNGQVSNGLKRPTLW